MVDSRTPPGEEEGGGAPDGSGRPSRTSELLGEIAALEGGERLSLEEVSRVVGGRAVGLLLLVLSLPETIPMVGLSAILAAPILVLGAVLLWKGADPPIPGWVRNRTLPREKVRSAVERTRPVVRWLDRVSRPRWPLLAGAGRLQGAVCIAMAVVLAIPIPGVNLLAAGAVAATGLGILQRDGLAVAGGLLLAGASLLGFAAVATGARSLVGGWMGG